MSLPRPRTAGDYAIIARGLIGIAVLALAVVYQWWLVLFGAAMCLLWYIVMAVRQRRNDMMTVRHIRERHGRG